ncbi:MAG: formylglycine-generating enzyme family protein [Saprospiraceae bacterium]|nr:formylglycine-generating enzyme family protein [Saprospiraceae bacterium]
MAEPHIDIVIEGIPPYRLLHIPGGEFLMGASDEDADAMERERPAHPVRLDDYYIGEFPVTQDLWEAVMNENPSFHKGPRRPVEQVSWNDINNKFLPVLNKMTAKPFRLPTEAEWEYAARGGPYWESEGYLYAGSDLLAQSGWYDENSNNEARDVGLLLPNALGLYDMSGNVWEWCADWFSEEYYAECKAKGLASNPPGPNKGGYRVYRGGSYFNDARGCRAAYRNRYDPAYSLLNIGFRLVCSLQSVG